ncbi:MAG: hypothetical protein KGL75_14190 [Acidobacteriota bacterium]|nr:hypothetical protein [Acidobacteriota bacterium]
MSRLLRSVKGYISRMLAICATYAIGVTSLAMRAAAQGCAMCYQSAAATGDHSRAALQHGILILLFPSAGIFAGIFALIYSRRKISR